MGQKGSVQLLNKIGEGSFGEVYKAKWNGRLVAAKRLHSALFRIDPGGEDGFVARFLDECRLLQKLTHPNILQLLHVDHKEGQPPILITELLVCDLEALVEKSQSEPKVATEDVLKIMLGVAKGLEYLHSHNVIHRDIAPKNILLDGENRAKIADVGLAKLAADYNSPVPGTPHYMAPETYPVIGSRVARYGIESDIYSFGVTLLEIIVGHPPRTLENPLAHDQASTQRSRHKRDLDEMGEDHPLRQLVMNCLEEHPEYRPTSTEIIAQLENPDFRKEIARFDLFRSVTKLEEEFLHWIPIRKRTIRELEELNLKDIAARLDKHHRNVNFATAAAATTSVLATGVAVAGFVSAFFTFGATIPVAIAGGVIGAAGGLTTFGSKMTEIILSKLASDKVSKALEDDQAACTNIRRRMSQLDELITINVLKIVDSIRSREEARLHNLEEVMELFEDMTGMAKHKTKEFGPIKRGTRGLSAVLGAATSCTTAGIAGARVGTAVAFDSLSAVARVTHIAGFVVSILALPFDIYFLAKSSKELIDGSPSEAAQNIRSIEERLVCPEKEEVSDLVQAYVEEKITEVARDSEWDIIDELPHYATT